MFRDFWIPAFAGMTIESFISHHFKAVGMQEWADGCREKRYSRRRKKLQTGAVKPGSTPPPSNVSNSPSACGGSPGR